MLRYLHACRVKINHMVARQSYDRRNINVYYKIKNKITYSLHFLYFPKNRDFIALFLRFIK